MDDLLTRCLDEVALEGLEGCTLARLWGLLEVACRFQMDKAVKQKVFDLLRDCPEITIYRPVNEEDSGDGNNNNNRGKKSGPAKKSPQERITRQGMLPELPRMPVSREQVMLVRTYEDIENLYIFVASFPLREYALGLKETDIYISDAVYCILEFAGKGRYEGAYQSKLAKQLGIDAKVVYHNIRKPAAHGLITTKQYFLDKKVATNLIRLRRFSTAEIKRDESQKEFEEYVEFKNKIIPIVTDLLLRAKDNIMVELEVKRAIGFTTTKIKDKHRWERIRRNLANNKPRIEVVQAIVNNRPVNCLRLVQESEDASEGGKGLPAGNIGLCAELPMLYQMFKKIEEAGPKGIPHPELVSSLGMDPKWSSYLSKELVKRYGVSAISEKVNKATTHTLVAPSQLEADSQSIINNLKNLEQGDFSGLGKASAKGTSGKQHTSPEHSEHDTAVSSDIVMIDNEVDESITAEPELPTDAEPNKAPPIADAPMVEATDVAPTKRKTRTEKKEKLITKQFADRCKFALEYLKEHPVCVGFEMKAHLDSATGDKMDRKTAQRVIQYLEAQKFLNVLNVNVPMLSGLQKRYVLVLQPDLTKDDKIVKDFIAALRDREVFIKKKPNLPLVQGVTVEQASPSVRSRQGSEYQVMRYHQSAYWLLRNGFINAKMIRIKLFHMFLWECYERRKLQRAGSAVEVTTSNTDSDKEDAESLSFHIADIVQMMPFGLYIQISGVEDLDGVENLEEAKKLSLAELPEALRARAFPKSRRHVPKFQSFLDALHRLGLIEPVTKEEMNAGVIQCSFFTLQSKARIGDALDDSQRTYDFLAPSEEGTALEILQAHRSSGDTPRHLYNVDVLEEYWDELEYFALNIRKEEIIKGDGDETAQDFLSRIPEVQVKANWSELKHFTITQLRALEACYSVNSSPSVEECVKLAREVRIPFEHVVLYFFRNRDKILQQSALPSRTRFGDKRGLSYIGIGRRKQPESKKKTSTTKGRTNKNKKRRRRGNKSDWELSDEYTDEEEEEGDMELMSIGDDDEDEEESDSELEDTDEDSADEQQPRRTAKQKQKQKRKQKQVLRESESESIGVYGGYMDINEMEGETNNVPGGTVRLGSLQDHSAAAKSTPAHVKAFQSNKEKDLDEIAESEKEADDEPETVPRRKWSPQEDLRLLHALAMDRDLQEDGQFVKKPINWGPIAKKLNKTKKQCKRRWSTLQRKPWHQMAVKMAVAQRQSQDIESEETVLRMIEQCRDSHKASTTAPPPSVESTITANSDTVVLPENVGLVRDHFSVFAAPLSKKDHGALNIGNNLGSSSSSGSNVSGGITPEHADVTQGVQFSTRESALADLMKVTLLTPESDYSFAAAQKLFKQFSSDEVDRCFAKLRNIGLIRKTKKRKGARGYQITSRFLDACKPNQFPRDLFETARRFEERFNAGELFEESEGDEYTAVFDPLSSGGEVAQILNMVAANQIKLVPKLTELEQEGNNGTVVGRGVSSHLLRVGAVKEGEDFVSGEIDSGHNLKLPDWKILIHPVCEPEFMQNNGLPPKRRRYKNATNVEYDIDKDLSGTTPQGAANDSSPEEQVPSNNNNNYNNADGDVQMTDAGPKDSATPPPTTTSTTSQLEEYLLRSNKGAEWQKELLPLLKYLLSSGYDTHCLDVHLSMFQFIDASENNGVTMQELQDKFGRDPELNLGIFGADEPLYYDDLTDNNNNNDDDDDEETQRFMLVDRILTSLLNFELVIRYNAHDSVRFISCNHAKIFQLLPFRIIDRHHQQQQQQPSQPSDASQEPEPQASSGTTDAPNTSAPAAPTSDAAANVPVPLTAATRVPLTLDDRNYNNDGGGGGGGLIAVTATNSARGSSSSINSNSNSNSVSNAKRIQYTDEDPVTIKPWLKLNGEVNSELYDKIILSLTEKILRHPGITEDKLIDPVAPLLGTQNVRDILDTMERDGVVSSRYITYRKHSLLSFAKDVVESASAAEYKEWIQQQQQVSINNAGSTSSSTSKSARSSRRIDRCFYPNLVGCMSKITN